MNIIATAGRLLAALAGRFVLPAAAHCDTEDGPAVADGLRALRTGEVNIALKWVRVEDEPEVRAAFAKAARVRAGALEAGDIAERWFLETLVRVHRAGEGAGYDGIKPVGTPVPREVVAADRALAEGRIDPLRGLVTDERWQELERRFEAVLALKGFEESDLVAGRRYLAAYVRFFAYAEGHDHDPEHGPDHDPDHGHDVLLAGHGHR